MNWTEADFDHLSWHDCHIWGIELRAGDPDEANWTSDLAFDIDFIVEWICGSGDPGQFRVAPATLVFHGVTDPKIAIDWGRSAFQVSLHPASIDHVERERIRDQKVYLDRPYYRWRIHFNWPGSSEITFGAVGFPQTLRAKPVLTEKQCLSFSQRSRLTGR
ncbi:MAG: hypothetical protein LAO31_16525 [Acidobacteriia bacterium]|nr:hypothetical protein [Terriglobia bacterium]